jgi:hypothetical protein
MVTAFLRFGVLARLQIGYKRQAAPQQVQKNPPRRVFLHGLVRITWRLGLLPQEPKPQLQARNHLPLGRKHLPLGRRLQQRVP